MFVRLLQLLLGCCLVFDETTLLLLTPCLPSVPVVRPVSKTNTETEHACVSRPTVPIVACEFCGMGVTTGNATALETYMTAFIIFLEGS